ENEGQREQATPDKLGYMKVFPNPATDELSIVFNLQEAGAVQLMVVSTTGQVAYRQAFQADAGRQESIMDVSQWTPGVYIVQLITDGRTLTQKVVVTGQR
ncbi:MAG: T9SS type A sorting domain-containing protein, partial [Phaeodactylibacter sp.]|nr:T9SS type A sorting domain-containing protein [Phaeodactylibacter sp.]